MSNRNDQVFQLSLTEIAFMLVFILLLLLGWMLFKADEDKKELEQVLQDAGDIHVQRGLLNQARASLTAALTQAGHPKPDDVISFLVSQTKLAQERDAFKKQIEDLDGKLSALEEIRTAVENAGNSKDEVARQEVKAALLLKAKLEKQLQQQESPVAKRNLEAEAVAALALKSQMEKQLREQLGTSYERGQEASLAKELVSAAKQARKLAGGSPDALNKDNADLRGQIAFLKGKLEARGGRDYPPCWAEEETGKVEFLFTIEILPEGLRLMPAWPPKRQLDAMALPEIEKLTETRTQTLGEFRGLMQGIDRVSKDKNCRHYVYIKNRVTDLESFNRYRYGIENSFYKLELRN